MKNSSFVATGQAVDSGGRTLYLLCISSPRRSQVVVAGGVLSAVSVDQIHTSLTEMHSMRGLASTAHLIQP